MSNRTYVHITISGIELDEHHFITDILIPATGPFWREGLSFTEADH
jgi:hypothetical protein